MNLDLMSVNSDLFRNLKRCCSFSAQYSNQIKKKLTQFLPVTTNLGL